MRGLRGGTGLGALRVALPAPIELEDPIQVREQHLDLLALVARDQPCLGSCGGTNQVASAFMDRTRNLGGKLVGQHRTFSELA